MIHSVNGWTRGVVPGVSHVKKCGWLVKNMTEWRLKVDLKKLNDWLMTCHNVTGGGGVMTTSVSEMHMRRIGLATRNQSALFMMSINWYYVKCVWYSVDSTASQQPTILQLQDIKDTSNDSTFTWMVGCVARLAERRSLAGEQTLSSALPAADGWPLCG